MERESYEKAKDFFVQRGYFGRVGFGRRPALVLVDFIKAFTLPECPLGADVTKEVAATQELIRVARRCEVPIIFAKVEYEPKFSDAGVWIKKIASIDVLGEGSEWVKFDSRVEPQPGDRVLVRKYPSAFFGTDLASYLMSRQIDTLLVTGFTTSGCVRATVVDGLQYGLRVIVVEDCVGDRYPLSHEVSLFDMDAKYADVVKSSEVIKYLESLRRREARDA